MAYEFTKAFTAANLSKIVADSCGKSVAECLQLVKLGAVYTLQPHHTSTITNSAEQLTRLPYTRRFSDLVVPEGTVVRYYLRPRRFPVENVNWGGTILKETDEYLLINKPAGVPSHAVPDNGTENVLYQIQELIDRRCVSAGATSLYLPQRLDTDTTGQLMIAKTAGFISWMSKQMVLKRCTKKYKALLSFCMSDAKFEQLEKGKLLNSFAEGHKLHTFMQRHSKVPRIYVLSKPLGVPGSEYQDAILQFSRVLPAVSKTLPDWRLWLTQMKTCKSELQPSADRQHFLQAMETWLSAWERNASSGSITASTAITHKLVFQEVTVELITGRTHQVRGQIQSLTNCKELLSQIDGDGTLGIHVAGDNLYQGCTSAPGVRYKSPFLALQSYSIQFYTKPTSADKKQEEVFHSLDSTWWCSLYDQGGDAQQHTVESL